MATAAAEAAAEALAVLAPGPSAAPPPGGAKDGAGKRISRRRSSTRTIRRAMRMGAVESLASKIKRIDEEADAEEAAVTDEQRQALQADDDALPPAERVQDDPPRRRQDDGAARELRFQDEPVFQRPEVRPESSARGDAQLGKAQAKGARRVNKRKAAVRVSHSGRAQEGGPGRTAASRVEQVVSTVSLYHCTVSYCITYISRRKKIDDA